MSAGEAPRYKIIGRGVPRHDARDKVFGQTKYADDFVMPGTLCAKVLRSKYAAAQIVSIDTSRAEAMPGVHAVLTAKDVPHNETTSKFGQTHSAGGGFEGLYRVVADGKVRYMGEAVALVAAETLAQAEDAARAVDVIYDPLPGVFDPIEALKPDAYRVGEEDSNVVCAYKVRKGDVEAGFAQADAIVEGEYRVPFGDHVFLEPESGTAWIDEDGVLTIRASTQVIEHFRDIADIMGLPHNRVRVIAPMLGGGFGGKEDITVEAYLALLAYKTKRPVRLTYTREESILAHSKRHPYVMRYKTGATKDGKLVALDVELVSDAGGYPFLSPWVLLYSVVMATGPYIVPNVRVDGVSALTNNTFTSAYRGFGAPQVCFAYESQMDELAKKLGLSPLEFRMRNYLHTGDELGTGYALESAVLTDETAQHAWDALGEPTDPRSPDEVVGRGIASGMQSYGRLVYLHDSSRAYVGFELDGSVVVRSGVQDIGGGQASSIAQITAEILGVPMDDITVYFGDTALTPLAGTTTATRMLYMSGNATLKAARAVREAIVAQASAMLEVDPERIDLVDRMVCVEGGEKSIPIVDVVQACASLGVSISNLAQFNAPSRDLREIRLRDRPDSPRLHVRYSRRRGRGRHQDRQGHRPQARSRIRCGPVDQQAQRPGPARGWHRVRRRVRAPRGRQDGPRSHSDRRSGHVPRADCGGHARRRADHARIAWRKGALWRQRHWRASIDLGRPRCHQRHRRRHRYPPDRAPADSRAHPHRA